MNDASDSSNRPLYSIYAGLQSFIPFRIAIIITKSMNSSRVTKIENFSFQGQLATDEMFKQYASISQKPSLAFIDDFSQDALMNEHTKGQWLDMAAEIARHKVSTSSVDELDFEKYSKLFLLMRESNKSLSTEQNTQDQTITKLKAKLDSLNKKIETLDEHETRYKADYKTLQKKIQELDQTKNKLSKKYQVDQLRI